MRRAPIYEAHLGAGTASCGVTVLYRENTYRGRWIPGHVGRITGIPMHRGKKTQASRYSFIMRSFQLIRVAMLMAVLGAFRLPLERASFETVSVIAIQDEEVLPQEDAPLGPAVDSRFGRTWKIQGLFGSGTAALVDAFSLDENTWTLYFLSAKHVTDANGNEFLLYNDVLGVTLDMGRATFVHPTEDAVLVSVSCTSSASQQLPFSTKNLRFIRSNMSCHVAARFYAALCCSLLRSPALCCCSVPCFDSASYLQAALLILLLHHMQRY